MNILTIKVKIKQLIKNEQIVSMQKKYMLYEVNNNNYSILVNKYSTYISKESGIVNYDKKPIVKW